MFLVTVRKVIVLELVFSFKLTFTSKFGIKLRPNFMQVTPVLPALLCTECLVRDWHQVLPGCFQSSGFAGRSGENNCDLAILAIHPKPKSKGCVWRTGTRVHLTPLRRHGNHRYGIYHLSTVVIRCCLWNAGIFVLRTICSLEHSFPWLNFRSRDHSFPGTFVLKTIRSLEHSFPGPFIPWTIRSRERINTADLSLLGTFPGPFIPCNFRSRYPGPFLPRTIHSFVSRAVPGPLTKKEQRLYFTEFFRTVDILLLFIFHSRPSTFALKIIILRTQCTMYCYGRSQGNEFFA